MGEERGDPRVPTLLRSAPAPTGWRWYREERGDPRVPTLLRTTPLTPTKSKKPINYPAFFVLGLGPGAHLRWA